MVSVGAVAGVIVLLCFVIGMTCIFINKSPRAVAAMSTAQEQGREQDQDQEQGQVASSPGPSGQQERGLGQDVMERLPLYQLPAHPHPHAQRNGEACPICLSPLLDGHFVRVLPPPCCHTFHLPCIDQWFLTHSNCPLCRLGITSPA